MKLLEFLVFMKMSNLRFIKGIECEQEPFIYICLENEGWFLLSQITYLFFPEKIENEIRMKIWSSKHIPSSKYFNTSLDKCHCRKLRDKKILKMLRNINITSGEYIIDICSTKRLLDILNPEIQASLLLKFTNIIHEILRKGGRKKAVSNKERMQIAASQNWACKNCEKPFGSELNFEVDHIFAWSKGGNNHRLNLQALCSECHKSKTHEEKKFLFKDIRY